MSLLALIIFLCNRKIKWVYTTIGLVSIPEIACWCFVVYLYLFNTSFQHIIMVIGAIVIHMIMNLVYGMTH